MVSSRSSTNADARDLPKASRDTDLKFRSQTTCNPDQDDSLWLMPGDQLHCSRGAGNWSETTQLQQSIGIAEKRRKPWLEYMKLELRRCEDQSMHEIGALGVSERPVSKQLLEIATARSRMSLTSGAILVEASRPEIPTHHRSPIRLPVASAGTKIAVVQRQCQ
jgi:hypothetical protein